MSDSGALRPRRDRRERQSPDTLDAQGSDAQESTGLSPGLTASQGTPLTTGRRAVESTPLIPARRREAAPEPPAVGPMADPAPIPTVSRRERRAEAAASEPPPALPVPEDARPKPAVPRLVPDAPLRPRPVIQPPTQTGSIRAVSPTGELTAAIPRVQEPHPPVIAAASGTAAVPAPSELRPVPIPIRASTRAVPTDPSERVAVAPPAVPAQVQRAAPAQVPPTGQTPVPAAVTEPGPSSDSIVEPSPSLSFEEIAGLDPMPAEGQASRSTANRSASARRRSESRDADDLDDLPAGQRRKTPVWQTAIKVVIALLIAFVLGFLGFLVLNRSQDGAASGGGGATPSTVEWAVGPSEHSKEFSASL